MSSTHQHAVVVGASVAGVLAARVLAEHFERVTLVDRDEMPRQPDPRGGVPQGRHVHGLLSRGRDVIESMFPGTTQDLVDRGAILGDALAGGRYFFGPRPLAQGDAHLPVLAVGRPLLEWYLRQRLLHDSRVSVLEHTSVLDLAFAAGDTRVTGAIVTDRDSRSPRLLAADLVVDASGRTSRTPEWLERRGYVAPVEDVRRVDKQYATRMFRRTSEPGQPVVRISASRKGFPRGGIMLAREGDVWMVSLAGRDGEQPPLELTAYRAWARTLATPELADAIDALVPLDDGVRYRFPANRRRHYEDLAEFPSGLVVLGDALCAFDPVHGQGMSVAAVEAEALGACLAEGTAGLGPRFHRKAAAVIDTPWTIAAGPPTTGRVPARRRLVDAYLARLVRAAADDAVLAAAFLRVSHLVDRPQDLMRPALARRVLRHSLPWPAHGVVDGVVDAGEGHTQPPVQQAQPGDGLVGAPGV
jgi:2-polyprenyl-6-methoxyphenol hydroxylase-like FAD-dependent oxidoreductase